jgi:hypothetical protein
MSYRILNVLHSSLPTVGNEMAFLFPLKKFKKKLLSDYKISINFYNSIEHPKAYDCDTLIISSWLPGRQLNWWATEKREKLWKWLQTCKQRASKVIWADISDSTGTTHFMVLPFVDLYLKGQILKNKNLYTQPYYGARYFCDYYYKHLGIVDDDKGSDHLRSPTTTDQLQKIKIGWNTGLATYSQWGPYYNLVNQKYFSLELPLFFPKLWTPPNSKRAHFLSCRIGTQYNRKTIQFHRLEVKKRVTPYCQTHKISRSQYFKELRTSFVSVTPFGLGEISLRDFEIVISGGLILKPNCSHMETWPNLFIDNKTYVDFNWDFSNLRDQIEWIKDNRQEAEHRAINCQNVYKSVLSLKSGSEAFCNRLYNICFDKQ